jgi:acyl dehydratase
MDMARPRSTTARIGASRDSEEFRTNTRRLAQFAEATGDTSSVHLSGSIASPVFHHVPVMQSMVEVLNTVTSGFILHGEQDFHFHRPMRPGQRLFSRSELIGTRQSSAGALYFLRCTIHTHDAQPISTQYATCLVQGGSCETEGVPPPDKPRPDRVGEPVGAVHAIAPDLTLRYGDAARDYSPYTIDGEAARELGLPAPIVHGMCTLALIARDVVGRLCAGDSGRLKRLGCRFSHPLLLEPGQDLSVRLWPGGGLSAFEAADSAGNLVVTNGFAEVSS